MDCQHQNVHHEEVVTETELTELDSVQGMTYSTPRKESSFTLKDPPKLSPCSSGEPESRELREFTNQDVASPLENSPDIIYDGGLPEDDDIDIKMILDETGDDNNNDIVEIEVRGTKYRIPFAIECHLCAEMMNLCLRRTRYRGQSREYPAYRCNRKGCQTFRSIRKVFRNCVIDGGECSSRTMVYQPITSSSSKTSKQESSDDDSDDYVIQRVCLPKLEKRNNDSKQMSVSDRIRKANQERAMVFSEFASQLRRDIAANKRVRVRKQTQEDEEPQGTLFFINKELNSHEIMELQDVVIKALISLRKIPPPMTMLDLPLFANCPYSKKDLEAGLESAKYREDFWSAFTNSPQPPLPVGFIRRKDDTLIYRDPKPYEVPGILQENSPRKQAEAVLSYQQRKEEQDAKKMERRHTEKKFRSWASLKREFDMAETDGCPTPKLRTIDKVKLERKVGRKVTLQELIDRMEGEPNGRMTGKIVAGNSERSSESMQWIDDRVPEIPEGSLQKSSHIVEYPLEKADVFQPNSKLQLSALHEAMRTLHTPPIRTPTSPSMRSFSSADHIDLKNSPMLFGDIQFNNNHNFYVNPYFNPYASTVDSNSLYQSSNDPYNGVGGSDSRSDYPFTYIHPDSGLRLTDPSTFLTSFIPSPVTKIPPISFTEETMKTRRNSEPSTSSLQIVESELKEVEVDVCEIDKKIVDDMLKFDPPIIGE